MTISKFTKTVAGAAASMCILAGSASALVVPTTLSFSDFSEAPGNQGGGPTIADQFSLTVTDTGAGVSFGLLNDANTFNSPVARMFAIEDTNNLLSFSSIANGPGTNFCQVGGSGSSACPGGGGGSSNALPQSGDFDEFVFRARSGNPDGAADGEGASFNFGFTSTNTFASVASAIDDGSLRFGLHIISIGDNESSDVIVSNPPMSAVPVPAALPLLLAGLGGLGFVGRKRRRAQA